MKRKIDLIFCILFFMIMIVPLVFAHHEEGRISSMENRVYASFPKLRIQETEENGTIKDKWNIDFARDFDSWINDNIRFRTIAVELNANIQYKLFRRITKDDERAGEDGELFFIKEEYIREFQHKNLMSDSELELYVNKMEGLYHYLYEKGIPFYYLQCYSKETIYPERYVKGIYQLGEMSRVDQLVKGLRNKTSVPVISLKEDFLREKEDANRRLYYKVEDPGHYNEYAAYLTYSKVVETMRKDIPDIRVASEDNYEISMDTDKRRIYGMTYPYAEDSLLYKIKEPKAVEIPYSEVNPELAEFLSYKEHTHYFENEKAGNDYQVLLLGDSFIRQFIKDDLAEHFAKTLSIDWLNIPKIDEILTMYEPDIVLLESAEGALDSTIPLIQEIDYVGQ